MTPQEQQQLKKLFVGTALYFNHVIADEALKLYVEDLDDLPFDQVAAALKEIRRDPKTTRCPLPAVIRARVMPQMDPEAEAIEAANRIYQAICQVGPENPEKAKDLIGELGWLVVQREGGWKMLCTSISNFDQVGTRKAQWREMAKAQHVRARSGRTGAPELPGAQDPRALPFDPGKLLQEMPKS